MMAGTKNSTTTEKSIRKKTAAILSDHKNANLLLDILSFNQSDDSVVISASCKALGDIFAHFLSQKQFLDPGKTTVAEEDLSKEDQFSSWLQEQFTTTCDVLCDNLNHDQSTVQISAMDALVTTLQAEKSHSTQGLCGKLIQNVMNQLLSTEQDQAQLIELLPLLLSVWEGSTEVTACCLAHLKACIKTLDSTPSDIFLFNCWRIIKQIAEQEIDDKSKKMLTAVVCQFLKHKMPTGLYREILTGISSIMEKMSTPIRLADFLSESFNIGGAISLMSLHGLFILMHKFNLDYPDFYKKMYSMFEPQVFGAKYRARFFHLADTFLSSTHLPSYLIAAFAKRLSRMCLHAPASGAHIAVPFVLNLISRHPACEVLLHRVSGAEVLDSDPYLEDEEDMSKCRALDSCLWELQTLERHYDPTLSQKAKKRQIQEEDLSVILDNTSSDIISSEAKKIKGEVPMTFIKPSGLEMPETFVL
ncbi:nucleolar complex protein 4 homolog isoform X1 [Aplysia californica]|uniref:Nucleolar complex protein 4 homolog isoform X1 n=2 Tax=Aplysia californica TaxID=6500 RepID=A0ABM0K1I0_APLCA|nr:nucleolar complex protein 4 homolog isoform X1 [Aplysia californica]